MSSQFRTALAGFGVIAICLVMASLKWQFLLLALAFAGVFAGILSWRQPSNRLDSLGFFDEPRRYGRRGRRHGSDNVLSFPQAGWTTTGVSDASGS